VSERKEITPEQVWKEYEKGRSFKEQINLFDTVKVNEDFFIGKQWEGVEANGLPTPVFNILRRIVLYLIATTATDNIAMAVHPLSEAYPTAEDQGAPNGQRGEVDVLCDVVRGQYDALMEHNKLTKLIREFMRDAAVRGDGCVYSWFDAEAETGQEAKGAIRTELLENTRVFFGDPNVLSVQDQPYLLITRRERIADVRREAEEKGGDPEAVKAEDDEAGDRFDGMTDDKVTTVTRFEKRDGTVWCFKTVKDGVVRGEWDTGMKLYPLVWMPWERVSNCYHGQAAVTGLIPNQIFVNKSFAMVMISIMTGAFPKILYDKTKVTKWDSGVGKAIPVNGGDVGSVAKVLDPANVSPQVGQFIEMAVSMTKELMGATDAALGNVRPENTSAILALQKSSSVPMELVRQDLYQSVEDLGRVWLDMMRCYYGVRLVKLDGQVAPFDFAALDNIPLGLKLDVGGSAYWSEIAQLQTLDNLLAQKLITPIDYLERLPNGYIVRQQELIDALKARMGGTAAGATQEGGSAAQDTGVQVPTEVPTDMDILAMQAQAQAMPPFDVTTAQNQGVAI